MNPPLAAVLEMRELRRGNATIRDIKQVYPEHGLATIWRAVKDIRVKRRPHPNRKADPADVMRHLATDSIRATARAVGLCPSRVVTIRQEQQAMNVSPMNPAEAHMDLILECWSEGMDTFQIVTRLEWEKVNLTEAQVANALARFKRQMGQQTEAQLQAWG